MVVAELSANHEGSLNRALETIEAAAFAGADAIKLQTYTAQTMTINSRNPLFQISGGTAWDGRTLFDLYDSAHTPWDWHQHLFHRANELGLLYFSTPFDATAVAFLEELDVPAYKIASFEVTDIELIETVARVGKPVMISTGIASYSEIKSALSACRRVGNQLIILMKCTSAYPARSQDINLRTMTDMREQFQTLVGLSDHSLTSTAALGAVALGAVAIEKHLTIDRGSGGPDSSFSLEPENFREMVLGIREMEECRGRITYDLGEAATTNRQFARSLFIVRDVNPGDFVTRENVRSIRPGYGLQPALLPEVLGRRFAGEASAGTPLSWSLLEDLEVG